MLGSNTGSKKAFFFQDPSEPLSLTLKCKRSMNSMKTVTQGEAAGPEKPLQRETNEPRGCSDFFFLKLNIKFSSYLAAKAVGQLEELQNICHLIKASSRHFLCESHRLAGEGRRQSVKAPAFWWPFHPIPPTQGSEVGCLWRIP